MIILTLLEHKTSRIINQFKIRKDQMPWEDIRVWQTFAFVVISVEHDA